MSNRRPDNTKADKANSSPNVQPIQTRRPADAPHVHNVYDQVEKVRSVIVDMLQHAYHIPEQERQNFLERLGAPLQTPEAEVIDAELIEPGPQAIEPGQSAGSESTEGEGQEGEKNGTHESENG